VRVGSGNFFTRGSGREAGMDQKWAPPPFAGARGVPGSPRRYSAATKQISPPPHPLSFSSHGKLGGAAKSSAHKASTGTATGARGAAPCCCGCCCPGEEAGTTAAAAGAPAAAC
jgi:hypothetical protein